MPSRIALAALAKPIRIESRRFSLLFINSSRMRSKMRTFASTAIPMVRAIPASPGSVKVPSIIDMIPKIMIALISNEMTAIIPAPK